MNLLNTVQSGIMWVGVAIGLLVCSAGVARGELSVGDVVLFLTLMAQLFAPLNWFGALYRTIQQVGCKEKEKVFSFLFFLQDHPAGCRLSVSVCTRP